MDYSFLAFIFRQKYIKRWSLMRNTSEENLSTHTMECALITHMLCEIGNKIFGKNYDTEKAVLTSLYHDSAEVITGDLPTPVKYYSKSTKESYGEIEENAIGVLLGMLPEDLRCDYSPLFHPTDPEIIRLVKTADKLCAYIKCIEEQKSGNSEFTKALASTRKALDKYRSDELDWFMDNMIPSFEKTLDEL